MSRRTGVILYWPLLTVLLMAPHALAQSQPQPELDDDHLYDCVQTRSKFVVRFASEVELKDLVTWAMGFSCKNFIY